MSGAVTFVSVGSYSFIWPTLTVEIKFNISVDNPPDQLALLFVNNSTGDVVDLNGNPYTVGSPPMPAIEPLDLSNYTAGTYTHTFTVNLNAPPLPNLPFDNYDIYVFAWPDNLFNEDYYIKELAVDDLDIMCFAAGTRIATPFGETAVEQLRPGDLVLTAGGRHAPVRFVGVQHVALRFASPDRANPVRIAAGALGPGLPARDLVVSPRHAIAFGDVLVEAHALVNGSTITCVSPSEDVISYYAIELDRHDLVLAEGVPAESFMDHVPRRLWSNHAEYAALYPEEPPLEELPQPRAVSARQVPAGIRAMLADRAAALRGVLAPAA